MTGSTPPQDGAARRYAPFAAAFVVLSLLVTADWPGPGAGPQSAFLSNPESTPASSPVAAEPGRAPEDVTAGPVPAAGGPLHTGPAPVGSIAAPGSVATSAGRAASSGCRADGRLPGVSVYSPPCVSTFSGSNGGRTARGVSSDKIIVARMNADVDPATRAVLSSFGSAGSPDHTDRAQRVFRRYFNLHYETYGREVVFVDVQQSGSDERAARADAERVIKETGAFAVIQGPSSTLHPAFTEELAARGGICVNCNPWPLWRAFYRRNVGKAWLALGPTIEQHYAHLAEYQARRLAGRPARWAGDPKMRSNPRSFGLIWLDGDNNGPNPESKTARDYYVSLLRSRGLALAAETSYVYDLSRTQEQATTAILRMKQAGVTTVVCMCDSITPIFFTATATRQEYFPEWLNPGLRQMDLNTIARLYDQRQWRNSFGFSPLPAPLTDPSKSEAFRAYKHVEPSAKPGDESPNALNIFPTFDILWSGITMAGPRLTADTFARGLFAYPATGGTPTAPLAHYTLDDPTHANDFAELFWDPDATGRDETGQNGAGMYRRLNAGRRYQLGEWPQSPPAMFSLPGTITTASTGAVMRHEHDGHTHPTAQRCRSCV